MLGLSDIKISTVGFLTLRDPLSYRRNPQKNSPQTAWQLILSSLLSCGLESGGLALLTSWVLLNFEVPNPAYSLRCSALLYASSYHYPGQHSHPFSYSSNTQPTFSFTDNPPIQWLFPNLSGNKPVVVSVLSFFLFVYSKEFHLTRKTCFST